MIFYYGSYSHDDNEVDIASIDCAMNFVEGVPMSRTLTYSLAGRKHADSVSALTTALTALEAAYLIQGQSFGLTGTAHVVDSGATIGGTRVIRPPSYPQGGGAQYTTFRDYTITLEAEIPATDIGVLSFNETITRIGTGGPRIIYKEALNGPPQAQQVRQATICRTIQSGIIVGNGSYPSVPNPIWPAFELVDQRQADVRSPRRVGRYGGYKFTEFAVAWKYVYESPFVLTGYPNFPPLG